MRIAWDRELDHREKETVKCVLKEETCLCMKHKNHFTVSLFGFWINFDLLSGWGDYF